MKATDALKEYCAALALEIEAIRAKANCPTTSTRDAHDLLTFSGGMESALEKARAYLIEYNDGRRR